MHPITLVAATVGTLPTLAFTVSLTIQDVSTGGLPPNPDQMHIYLPGHSDGECTASPVSDPVIYRMNDGFMTLPRREMRTPIVCMNPDSGRQVITIHQLASVNDRVLTISPDGKSFRSRME